MINVSLLLCVGKGVGKVLQTLSVVSAVAIRFLAWEEKKKPYNFIHNLGENKFKSVYYIFNFKIVIKAASLYLLGNSQRSS